ncbi:MAG: hypothetical protein RR444_04900 [Oscillospiraceae bacterium]
MSKTITANFESIDTATLAASNAKDRCSNVKGVKVKYKSPRHEQDSYLFSNMFTPVDASTPSVLQNGIFPVAVNIDPIGQHSPYPTRNQKATVEITATGGNLNTICSTLRQGGGIGIKIK